MVLALADLRAQNVTVPNGSLDPWHALALVNSSDAFYDACAKRRGEAPPRAWWMCQAV